MRNLIVELVGPPGVGKSTVGHALSEQLRQDGRAVSEPSFELARKTGSMGLQQLRHAIGFFLREPALTLRWISLAFRSRPTTIRRGATRALDALYGCSLIRRHAGRPGVHVFDQGILQSVASILYSGRSSIDPLEWGDAIARSYEAAQPIVVVFVHATPEIILQRLRERSGGRSAVERIESPEGRARALSKFIAAVDDVERLSKSLGDRIGDGFEVLAVSNNAADSSPALANELSRRLTEMRSLS